MRTTALRLLASLSACLPLAAADGGTATMDPIPEVVRVRMAETAKGGELRDYAVTQQDGHVVYTAQLTDPTTGERSIVTVTQDGRLLGVRPIESPREAAKPQKPLDPEHVDSPPTRTDGKDADPVTRRGVEPGARP